MIIQEIAFNNTGEVIASPHINSGVRLYSFGDGRSLSVWIFLWRVPILFKISFKANRPKTIGEIRNLSSFGMIPGVDDEQYTTRLMDLAGILISNCWYCTDSLLFFNHCLFLEGVMGMCIFTTSTTNHDLKSLPEYYSLQNYWSCSSDKITGISRVIVLILKLVYYYPIVVSWFRVLNCLVT